MRLIIILIFLFINSNLSFGQSTLFNKTYDDRNYYNGSMCVLFDQKSQSYVLGGSTDDWLGYDAGLIIKINSLGDTIWQRFFDFSPSGESINSSCLSKNGNYIFVGHVVDTLVMRGEISLIEIDTAGNLLWWKHYGDSVTDIGQGVKLTPDGGYIISGWSYTDTSITATENGYVLKTDSVGNLLWGGKFGGNSSDLFYSVDLAIDGGYILGGSTNSYGLGGTDLLMVKIDSIGNFKWQKTFGTINNDFGHTVISTLDGGYAIIGSITRNLNEDAFIVKTDNVGNIEWEKTFGTLQYLETFYSLKQSLDSNLIAVGTSERNNFEGILVKYKQNGDTVLSKYYRHNPISTYNDHYFYDVAVLNNGGFAICGMTIESNKPNKNDFWLVVTDSLGCDNSSCVIDGVEEETLNSNNTKIYPIPACGMLNIDFDQSINKNTILNIFDIDGKLIKSELIFHVTQQYQIDISDLISGVYILQLKSKLGEENLKFLVQ